MAQQNDGLLDLFFPPGLSYHLVFVVVIMKSKVASPPDKSTLSKIHRDKSRIVKGARKELHTFAADALDKVKSSANIDDCSVRVSLGTYSRGLLELEEELSKAQKDAAKNKKILWEGRYCDYLAKVLGKVKSSQAWQKKVVSLKHEQWNIISRELKQESENGELHLAIRSAAKELGFSYHAIRSWIDVYVSRCESKAHQGNLETILKAGDIHGGRDQIWSDIEQLADSTPLDYQKHASHVMTAIIDYQNTLFTSCPKYGTPVMTKQGKKLTGTT